MPTCFPVTIANSRLSLNRLLNLTEPDSIHAKALGLHLQLEYNHQADESNDTDTTSSATGIGSTHDNMTDGADNDDGLAISVTAQDREDWQRMLDGLAGFPQQPSPYGQIFAVRFEVRMSHRDSIILSCVLLLLVSGSCFPLRKTSSARK